MKELTYQEFAEVLRSCAGVTVDPGTLESGTVEFADIDVDSLGLLGVVAELQNRFGATLGTEAESSRSPRELIDIVNAQLRNGD